VWRGGSAWTHQHEAWLGATYVHDRAVVATRHAQLDAVEVDLATWLDRPPSRLAAQLRLSARFRALAARKNTKSIVAAAIARELAGFLWAEMVA
jgi:hypothetical protein